MLRQPAAGPAPGYKEKTNSTARTFHTQQADDFDFAGAGQMSASAGVQVDPFNLNQPHAPFVAGRQAPAADVHAFILLPAHAAGSDRTSRTDRRCRLVLQFGQLVRGKARALEVDIAAAPSQMKGQGWPPVAIGGHSRQEMLGRVLLHVIEAAIPVELQMAGAGRHRAGQVVEDAAVPFLSVFDPDIPEQPAVSGLASALRVAEGVLENGEGPVVVVAGFDNLGVELTLVGMSFKKRDGCQTSPTASDRHLHG